uniref:Uncharacterized protein n=1 Tax=Oryza glumipatula TaxID=40148 RepID=A0A0E0AGD1_9ORYZ
MKVVMSEVEASMMAKGNIPPHVIVVMPSSNPIIRDQLDTTTAIQDQAPSPCPDWIIMVLVLGLFIGISIFVSL